MYGEIILQLFSQILGRFSEKSSTFRWIACVAGGIGRVRQSFGIRAADENKILPVTQAIRWNVGSYKEEFECWFQIRKFSSRVT